MRNIENVKSIHWDITRKCNLRCAHCYNAEKYFNSESPEYIGSEMNLEECLRTVDVFYENGFNHIHFLGGEPLASPYLFDVISRAKGYGMTITINSNAVLLNKETQQKLIDAQIDQFAASLDGCTSDINDRIRGEGAFDKVCENMISFKRMIEDKKSTIETVIVFTLTKANVGDINRLPSIAHKLKVDLITLTTFIESGNGRKNKTKFNVDVGYMCNKIEEMVACELLQYDIALQLDMRPLFCDYLKSKYQARVMYNKKNSLCSAGENVWYLEANGHAHPCLIFQLDSGKKALQGGMYVKEELDIMNVSIGDITNSNYWNSFLDKKREFDNQKISTCRGCSFADECQPCFLDYGLYDRQVLECEYIKKISIQAFDKLMNMSICFSEGVEYQNKLIMKDSQVVFEIEDEMTKYVMDFIRNGGRVSDLYNTMSTTYDVELGWLKIDLLSFINQLIGNDIVFLKEKNALKYKQNESLIIEEIGEEIIIFNPNNDEFFELNAIGSYVWNNIENYSFEKMIENVIQEYDINESIVTEDIMNLIDELLSKKLILCCK